MLFHYLYNSSDFSHDAFFSSLILGNRYNLTQFRDQECILVVEYTFNYVSFSEINIVILSQIKYILCVFFITDYFANVSI